MPKAVIFDMDGVLSDTEHLHAQVENEILKDYGIDIPLKEISLRFAGIPAADEWPVIFAENHKPLPPLTELTSKKIEGFIKLAKGRVKEIPGAGRLIRLLKQRSIAVAVASSSKKIIVDLVLNELGLSDMFDAVTTTEEVQRNKPAPDIFLLTAKKLSMDPSACFVIEDARTGVAAAKAAGMKCVGLRSAGSSQDLSQADIVVNDLMKSLSFIEGKE